jgi:ABC-type spermidine/putrescine transport system permease subunit I
VSDTVDRVPPSRWLLLLPVALVLGLFFTSVVMLFSNAFIERGTVSFRYFQQILDRPDYQWAFYRTVLSSLIVSFSAVLLSYPIALLLWRSGDRWRNSLLILVLVPWLVSLVVRSYGWIILLGPKGFINAMLAWIGVIDAPLPLMFNDFGIILGLTHVLMPFAVISILSSLLAIEQNMQEASNALGATGFQTFRKVVFPLSLPGTFTALMVVYLACIGSIVTPLLLGGVTQKYVGSQIYQEVMSTYNMNKGAAWSLCLLAISFASLVVFKAVERRALRGHS